MNEAILNQSIKYLECQLGKLHSQKIHLESLRRVKLLRAERKERKKITDPLLLRASRLYKYLYGHVYYNHRKDKAGSTMQSDEKRLKHMFKQFPLNLNQ